MMNIKKPLITRIVGNRHALGFAARRACSLLIAIVLLFVETGYAASGPLTLRPALQFSKMGREATNRRMVDEQITAAMERLASFAREKQDRLVDSPLHWRQAGAISWEKLVRFQTQPSSLIQVQNDERYGDWHNRAMYWLNQFDAREEWLSFISNIATSKEVALSDFVSEIERLRRLIIGGLSGKRWYQGPSFLYDLQHGKVKGDAIEALRALCDEHIDMERNRSRLEEAKELTRDIVLVQGITTVEDLLKKLSSLYWNLLYEERKGRYLFSMYNNSHTMNIVNTFLQLYGLRAITHELDLTPSNDHEFFKKAFIRRVLQENRQIALSSPIADLLLTPGHRILERGTSDALQDRANLTDPLYTKASRGCL